MLSAQAKNYQPKVCGRFYFFSPNTVITHLSHLSLINRTAGRKEARERKWKHYDTHGVELAVWTMWRPHGVRRIHKKQALARHRSQLLVSCGSSPGE